MIRIGLDDEAKQRAIDAYQTEHLDVAHVIVFSPDAFRLPGEWEQYSWVDIIMYKVFYPLLERIDSTYLIVVNELLRTKNRNDLTYNCLHHYLNQTPHRIIFQWFPVVDEPADFMILADNEHPGRFKGRGFSPHIFEGLDIGGIDRRPTVSVIDVPIPDGAVSAYEKERDRLFDTLEHKDPDTIPRHLHLWAGRYKKPLLVPECRYLARNTRYKLPNIDIATYKDATDARRISIDIPHRRMDLNDYLCRAQVPAISFLATPLKVDQYYAGELLRWHEMAGDIYAQAGIRP